MPQFDLEPPVEKDDVVRARVYPTAPEIAAETFHWKNATGTVIIENRLKGASVERAAVTDLTTGRTVEHAVNAARRFVAFALEENHQYAVAPVAP